MTVTLPTIAILGTGSMGGAILAGLLNPNVVVEGGVRVTNRSAEKAAALQSETVTSLATNVDPDANRVAVTGARIVLIGVKPAMVPDLLREVADSLEPGAIVVSVAAGVTIETMESLVPGAVLRAMPNTPSVVGKGVTGLAAGTRSSDDDLAVVRALFETVGDVLVIPESQIDALGTISGSGPAYVYFLIERLTRTAVNLGFTEEQAATMVNGTFIGATALLEASESTPTELRVKVTSPKGTTERAVAELDAADLTGLFDRATAAALARSAELAKGA
ncbi:pyrroline-5-carboxylate reductase [Conyzicola nivalis]|uniref:Pyrroline-5-carboxylate reductase n=1 Tax=Conyzicola nivalis TaxID=1477021 RepID=A0A916WKD5_9MICO|nr:pyrroline-5-carboxylate reductase [Conyzicola nivalis]GGB06255.1 pyrroline-5-carboxylate reductase [Conyzicola nivalis]